MLVLTRLSDRNPEGSEFSREELVAAGSAPGILDGDPWAEGLGRGWGGRGVRGTCFGVDRWTPRRVLHLNDPSFSEDTVKCVFSLKVQRQ